MSRRSTDLLAALLLLILGFGALLTYWNARLTPVQGIVDAPARLQCVSYAPYRRAGDSPFDQRLWIARDRIAEDLRTLSASTDCVRTYSVERGLDAVPEEAAKLGMKVILGAWIGRERERNEAELAVATALANTHKNTVRALVVGNEVLLRRELPASALRELIERARRTSQVPVTYADVWEFWSQNRDLADVVSFVTVHILPYWEDDPIDIARGVDHVVSIWRRVQPIFAGKRVLIGETGWPSEGRTRRGAEPGLVNQARFVREFTVAARTHGIEYNLIEAFDQPWKRRLEGAMGGHWGVFDSDARPKFPFQGAVVEDTRRWFLPLTLALGGALVGVGAAFATRKRRLVLLRDAAPTDLPNVVPMRRVHGKPTADASVHDDAMRPSALGVACAALLGACTGLAAPLVWRELDLWNRSGLEWAGSGAYALAVAPTAIIAAMLLGKREAVTVPGIVEAWRGSDARGTSGGLARAWSVACAFWLFGAAVMLAYLVFDARYRGLPWLLYCVPALAILAVAAAGSTRRSLKMPEERLVAALIMPLAAGVLWLEGLENRSAIGLCALIVAMALPFVLAPRGARQQQHGQQ